MHNTLFQNITVRVLDILGQKIKKKMRLREIQYFDQMNDKLSRRYSFQSCREGFLLREHSVQPHGYKSLSLYYYGLVIFGLCGYLSRSPTNEWHSALTNCF